LAIVLITGILIASIAMECPVKHPIPAWVGWTYLIYCLAILVIVIGGCGYAVFVLGYSGWWWLLAVFIAGGGYRPGRWAELVTGDSGIDREGHP
jgi:hypothetical protein